LGPQFVSYVNAKRKTRSIFSMVVTTVKLSGTRGCKSCADPIKTEAASETLLKIGTQSLITTPF
jgi:hypothetical protein